MTVDRRVKIAFLFLVLAQAAHSIEEYAFRLYDVFAPARFLSGLVSADLQLGFVVLNTSFVAFGAWCYVWRVRPGHPSATALIWLWVIVETINGIGHPAISLARGAYLPGTMTAPILLVLAVYLATQLRTHAAPLAASV